MFSINIREVCLNKIPYLTEKMQKIAQGITIIGVNLLCLVNSYKLTQHKQLLLLSKDVQVYSYIIFVIYNVTMQFFNT